MPEKKRKKTDPVVEQTLEVPAVNPALESADKPPPDPVPTYPLLDLNDPAPPTPAPAEPPPTLETPALSDNPALKSLARRKKPQ